MVFGEILANLRKKHGFTQKEVASSLHISKSALSNYEKSIHFPPYDILVKLCDMYHVSTDYVFGRTHSTIEIDKLNQKLPYGYTAGDCLELILTSDKEHQAHMIKYFELTQVRMKEMKKN